MDVKEKKRYELMKNKRKEGKRENKHKRKQEGGKETSEHVWRANNKEGKERIRKKVGQ